MAAPTNAANVKKALANSEPSTHGTRFGQWVLRQSCPREFSRGAVLIWINARKQIGYSNLAKNFFSLLQRGIEMCPAQVNDEFEVTINETNVTAVHREHKHQYFFPRMPNSPQLGPATWQENLSAERRAQDYVDSAHEAARRELQRAGILAGSEI